MSVWYLGDTAWTDYYYVKNLQGDVLQVRRASDDAIVASYTYDAWGSIISKSGSLAELNPFRYRGYYYDTETWFYYLQSRYYDPAIGRFINADAFASTGQGLLGNNMFAYCGNNPVSMYDPSGDSFSYACYCDDPFEEIFRQFGGGGGAGNAVAAAVAGAATAAVVGMVAVATTSHPKQKEETKAEAITKAVGTYHQEFFPENPLEFAPRGLIPRVYVDINSGPNGGIIKWEIPGTKIAVFEWNQDYIFGSHYHVMLPGWNNAHKDPYHYKPGTPVPEPWNSTYFGG